MQLLASTAASKTKLSKLFIFLGGTGIKKGHSSNRTSPGSRRWVVRRPIALADFSRLAAADHWPVATDRPTFTRHSPPTARLASRRPLLDATTNQSPASSGSRSSSDVLSSLLAAAGRSSPAPPPTSPRLAHTQRRRRSRPPHPPHHKHRFVFYPSRVQEHFVGLTKMSNWNDLSRDRLIKEYRKHPCLWSNKDGDAKNAEKRKECLNSITAELNKHEEKPFTQEEVRTQFKNLRDMYRRKRKKLHLQQEVNPAAALDEPGWIYYTRLKFLDDIADFSPPNESPPPPPKKKGKLAATRPTDDASLPTPLEESSASIPAAAPPPIELEQKPPLLLMKRDNSPKVLAAPAELVTPISSQEQLKEEPANSGGLPAANQSHAREREEPSPSQQQSTNADELLLKEATQTGQSSQQQQLETTTTVKPSSSAASGSSRESKSTADESAEDEFACFGRFVAMALKKVSTRSPVGALEARKEISDVLYRAELNSLPH